MQIKTYSSTKGAFPVRCTTVELEALVVVLLRDEMWNVEREAEEEERGQGEVWLFNLSEDFLYLVPWNPGISGSSNELELFDKIKTTRRMSGRSLGSACAQRSPRWMQVSTWSSAEMGIRVASTISRLRFFRCDFQACRRIRSSGQSS